MKRLLLLLTLALSMATMVVSDADARRLGGGGSIGRQSSGVTRQYSQPSRPSYAPQQAPAPAGVPPRAPSRPSPWRGIFGGALLGLGLGALFSHFGIGGAFAGFLGTLLTFAIIIFAVMFLLRLLRRNTTSPQPAAYASYGAPNDAGDGGVRTPEIGSRLGQSASYGNSVPVGGGASAPWGVPADFDTAGFLRHAKTYFIRLQTAWDRADVNDVREFSTPEMFGELRLQLQERGASPNSTDVVSLDAELLGIENSADEYLASVRFSGMIREAENAPAAPFAEVWNLVKPASGQGGWLLAGIQQLS